MPPVLEERISRRFARGIGPRDRKQMVDGLKKDTAELANVAAPAELEEVRERKVALQTQLDELRNILERSRRSLDLNEGQLHRVLCESLGMVGAKDLTPTTPQPTSLNSTDQAGQAFSVPALELQADSTWADTLDTLRSPRPQGMPVAQWRSTAPIRPVVFKDPGHIDEEVVHLHLEHRFVRRLLGQFLAQGFAQDKLSRACVVQTSDPIPRVVLIGRLSLYGERAARLHDELVSVSARWSDTESRKGPLKPYAEDAQERSWDLLTESFSRHLTPASRQAHAVPPVVQQNILRGTPQDVADLRHHLIAQCKLATAKAIDKLEARGQLEASQMVEILEGQKKRIEHELAKVDDPQQAFEFKGFDADEQYQHKENAKFWKRRLDVIPREIMREPERIRKSYSVVASRIEPVGIVYLWPVTG